MKMGELSRPIALPKQSSPRPQNKLSEAQTARIDAKRSENRQKTTNPRSQGLRPGLEPYAQGSSAATDWPATMPLVKPSHTFPPPA